MNILAVGAHFDDIELGCGGALLKHVQKGDRVILFVATTSGYLNPERESVRRSQEAFEDGREAARIIGGKLICGAFETLKLEFEDSLNAKLVHLIENEKIDLLYTHFSNDPQHDHRALALASVHAARHVPRILGYRCTWYQSDVPFAPNFYVDISDVWDKKEASIKEYRSEYARVGEDRLNFFKNDAQNNGRQMGVELAEGFQCIRWLVK